MMVHPALDGPIPWNAGERVSDSSLVHVGPYTDDIARTYVEETAAVIVAVMEGLLLR